MPINKNLGENEGIDAGTDPSETVSYVGAETEAETPEERSDAQRVADGDIELSTGDDEVFVSPNSAYNTEGESEEEVETSETPADDGEETAEAEPEEKPKESAKKPAKKRAASAPDKVQKRINKITREKYDLKRSLEAAEARAAEAEKKLKEAETAKEKAEIEGAKPQIEDFETDAEYYEALGRWGAKMEVFESRTIEKVEEKPAPQADDEDPRERIIELGNETYDDFLDVVGSIPVSEQTVRCAAESEYAHEILYHLGQHPEEAKKIHKMQSPTAVARAIGRIEAMFDVDEVVEHLPEQDTELPTNSKKPRPSKAPKPVKPVGNKGKAVKSVEDMSLAEYYEKRGFTRDGMPKRMVS